MAQTIKIRRTSTPGKTPVYNTDIVTGELALNTADGRVFIADGARVRPIVTTGNVVTGSITISGSFITRKKGFVSSSGALFASLSLNNTATLKTVVYNTSTGKFFYTGSYGGGGGGGGGGPLTGTENTILYFDAAGDQTSNSRLAWNEATDQFSTPNSALNTPGNLYANNTLEFPGSLIHRAGYPTVVNAGYGGKAHRIHFVGLSSDNNEWGAGVGGGPRDGLTGIATGWLPKPLNLAGTHVTFNGALEVSNFYLIQNELGEATVYIKTPITPGPGPGVPGDTDLGGLVLDNSDTGAGTTVINGNGIKMFNALDVKNKYNSSGSLVVNPSSASINIGLASDSSSLAVTVRGKKNGVFTTFDALYISQSGGIPKIGIGTRDPKSALDIKEVIDDGSGTEFILQVSRTTKGAQSGDTAAKINFVIDSGSYKDYKTSASIATIEAEVATITSTGASGKLRFKVSDESNAKGGPVEVLRLQKNFPSDVTDTVAYVSGRMELSKGIVAGESVETNLNVIANAGYVATDVLRVGAPTTNPGGDSAYIHGTLRVGSNVNPGTNGVYVHGAITSSRAKVTGNVDIDGILSLGGFANVSASLAAAVAGGDNLGNHTATQNLNMATFAITNVGNVDGVDVSVLKSDFDTLKGKTLVSGSAQLTRLTATTQITGSNSAAVRIGTYPIGYEVIPGTFDVTGSGIIIRKSGLPSKNYPMVKIGDVELIDFNSAITPNTFMIRNVDTFLVTSGSEPSNIYTTAGNPLIEHTGTQFNVYAGNTARIQVSSGSTSITNTLSSGNQTNLRATSIAASNAKFIPVWGSEPNIAPIQLQYVTASAIGGSANEYIVTQPAGTSAGTYGQGTRILKGRVTGASLTAGKVYYLNNNAWTLATNANSGSTHLLTVCTTTTDGSSMVLEGSVNTATAVAGPAGKPLYLGTNGDVTSTVPSSAGAYVRVIGYILKDNEEIYFNPSSDWIVRT